MDASLAYRRTSIPWLKLGDMLELTGYINIIIAIMHLLGLAWAKQMFRITGIEKEMNRLAQIHTALPVLLTVFVAILFFIFGLYGLSAAGRFPELPFMKAAIFVIAGIYLLRGVLELALNARRHISQFSAEALFSFLALAIGLLFLTGGLRTWYFI